MYAVPDPAGIYGSAQDGDDVLYGQVQQSGGMRYGGHPGHQASTAPSSPKKPKQARPSHTGGATRGKKRAPDTGISKARTAKGSSPQVPPSPPPTHANHAPPQHTLTSLILVFVLSSPFMCGDVSFPGLERGGVGVHPCASLCI